MYFVYFYAGHTLHELVLQASSHFTWSRLLTAVAVFSALFLAVDVGPLPVNGASIFAIATTGIAAVCLFSMAVANSALGRAIAYVGVKSLPIYLAHIFVISILRQILRKMGWLGAPTVTNFALIAAGIGLPIIGFNLAERMRLGFLFKIPQSASAWIAERLWPFGIRNRATG